MELDIVIGLYEGCLHDFEKSSENSKILSQYLTHYGILEKYIGHQ